MSKKHKKTEQKTDVSLDDVYQAIKSMNDTMDFLRVSLCDEVKWQSERITMLNETVYEDRHVLADFVRRFMKDSRDFLDPNIGIDGGPKAYPGKVKQPIKNMLKK